MIATPKSIVPRTCLLAAAVLQSGCSLFGIRGVEEAGYTLVRQQGSFEIRRYDSLVMVETRVDTEFDEAGRIAFGRLFGYISGDNRQQQDIPMTAPVTAVEAAGEEIEMTAPVVAEASAQGWRFAFVLPRDIDFASAPVPTRTDVGLVAVPAKTVAVVRYSGAWSEIAYRDNLSALRRWIAEENLQTVSPPRVAGYDPPWTIPLLRRNEVLIDIEY